MKAIGNAFIEYLKTISNELTEIEKSEDVAEEKFNESSKVKGNNKLVRIPNEKKE